MSTFIGIDKLHLTSADFQVKDLNSPLFSIDSGTKQGKDSVPYLLTDSCGKQVHAWKASHKGEKGYYCINQHGLLVQFNPSKIHHPYLLKGVDSIEYNQSVKLIQQELQTIGIQVNLEDMNMSRVDLARQVEMYHPLHQYHSAFQLLKAPRAKGRQYDGGYLFHNKANEIMFYDKQKELQYQDMDIMYGEKNLFRGEIRQLKSDAM